MRAALADGAAIEHGDNVRAANGRKAVGDDENGAPGHQIVQRALHQHFRFGVELRRGFVENQDGRVFQQRARDGQALALAAGKALAAVADHASGSPWASWQMKSCASAACAAARTFSSGMLGRP